MRTLFKKLAGLIDFRLCTRFRAERDERESSYRRSLMSAQPRDCRPPTSDVGWSVNARSERY